MCIVHRGEGPESLRPTCSCSKEPYFFCERAHDAVLFMLTPNLKVTIVFGTDFAHFTLRHVTARCNLLARRG